MKVDPRCNFCGLKGQSANHITFKCYVTRQVYALSNFLTPQNDFCKDSLFVNMFYLFQMGENIQIPSDMRKNFSLDIVVPLEEQNKMMFESVEVCCKTRSRTLSLVRFLRFDHELVRLTSSF